MAGKYPAISGFSVRKTSDVRYTITLEIRGNMSILQKHPYSSAALISFIVFFLIPFIGLRLVMKNKQSIFPSSEDRVRVPQTSTVKPTPTPKPVPDFSSLPHSWGAYVGDQLADITAFEKMVGRPVPMLATFVHWGNNKTFPTKLASHPGLSTIVIFWEAKDYNIGSNIQPRYNYDSVLSGKWDSYFKEFASQSASFKGQVILVPYSEMNGDWSPWSGTLNGNSPEKHIAAYRYIRKFFTSVSNVKFGWTVNNTSLPETLENAIERYYPGDEYVDYVGVDGFNFNDGEWETWESVFDDALTRVGRYPKPIFIFSTASAPGPQKAQWISDGFGKQIKRHRNVIGFIWFNENKEKDWRINSDPNSLAAFKQVISQW